jgi:hypothetical protein
MGSSTRRIALPVVASSGIGKIADRKADALRRLVEPIRAVISSTVAG